MMGPTDETGRLVSVGKLAACRAEVERLRDALASSPRWLPGAALRAQAEEVLRLLGDLRERLERKLVISMIGPSGAGKSTLINALAGIDTLSEVGNDRPTTRRVVVVCREAADARDLQERIGEKDCSVVVDTAALPLEHVMLVDTPDVDSNMCPVHRPIVEKAVEISDVLICVFHVENPKRRDTIDFLAPFVRLFHGESVYAILNQCDRQDGRELREEIVPDFRRHLEEAWDREHKVLCTSARRHLREPRWEEGEAPRHEFDEFPALRDDISGSLDRAGRVVDVRVRRAEYLRDYVQGEAREKAGERRELLEECAAGLKRLESAALTQALNAVGGEGSGLSFGVNTMFYQRLSERWWGPTGWLVALWARITVFGTGIVSAFRIGRPVRQIWGAVSSALRWRESQSAVAEASRGRALEPGLTEYRTVIRKGWPDLAERLVEAGFDESVRETESVFAGEELLSGAVLEAWDSRLRSTIDTVARKISGLGIQVVLNLPAIVLVGVICYQCVVSFATGEYLSADYFRHAIATFLVVWILPFVLYQFLVRSVGGDRLVRRAMRELIAQVEAGSDAVEAPILKEIEAVLVLSGRGRGKNGDR